MSLCRAFASAGVLLLVMLAGVTQAASERRVALVIGNSQYESVSRLPNPKPDAEMVAASLREAGFAEVTLATDLTREKLVDALHRFAGEAERADWAVIYYAGHGIEMNGMNYLIPINARLKTDRDLQFEAVPLTQALTSIEGAKKLRLLILDACRDNPFSASMERSLGATRSIGRGLARIEPDAGTLVAYAAKHGQTAADGEGAHSPFVSSLVKHISTPGLEINRLFRRVTSDVLVATNRRQEPFTYGSLPDEDFYFRVLPVPVKEPVAAPVQSAPTPTISKPAIEKSIEPAPAATPIAPAQSAAIATPTIVTPDIPAGQPVAAPPVAPPIPASPTVKATPVMKMTPAIRVRPIIKPRIATQPASPAVKPKRVAQRVERPEPRIVRPMPRSSTNATPSARGNTKCFTFNGARVCE